MNVHLGYRTPILRFGAWKHPRAADVLIEKITDLEDTWESIAEKPQSSKFRKVEKNEEDPYAELVKDRSSYPTYQLAEALANQDRFSPEGLKQFKERNREVRLRHMLTKTSEPGKLKPINPLFSILEHIAERPNESQVLPEEAEVILSDWLQYENDPTVLRAFVEKVAEHPILNASNKFANRVVAKIRELQDASVPQGDEVVFNYAHDHFARYTSEERLALQIKKGFGNHLNEDERRQLFDVAVYRYQELVVGGLMIGRDRKGFPQADQDVIFLVTRSEEYPDEYRLYYGKPGQVESFPVEWFNERTGKYNETSVATTIPAKWGRASELVFTKRKAPLPAQINGKNASQTFDLDTLNDK